MLELFLTLFYYCFTFFLSLAVAAKLFNHYILAFLISVLLVGFLVPCLSFTLERLKQIQYARSVLFFYQDQISFIFGPLESVEFLAVLVLILVGSSLFFGLKIFQSARLIVFQELNAPEYSQSVKLILTYLITLALTPAAACLCRTLLLISFCDRGLLRLTSSKVDSVKAIKKLELKNSPHAFVCRRFKLLGKFSDTDDTIDTADTNLSKPMSPFFAFQGKRLVMRKRGPLITQLIFKLLIQNLDRLILFAIYSLKAVAWSAGAWWVSLQWGGGQDLALLTLVLRVFGGLNAVAAFWWIFSKHPFTIVNRAVEPTSATLGRPAYKFLEVV